MTNAITSPNVKPAIASRIPCFTELQHAIRLRAHGHADANLARLLDSLSTENAINADHRENEGESSEQRQQCSTYT